MSVHDVDLSYVGELAVSSGRLYRTLSVSPGLPTIGHGIETTLMMSSSFCH